jgi:hypothetical protein
MAYSADSPGGANLGRCPAQPGDTAPLQRAVGRVPVHFAGEHTAGEWAELLAALMEGALRPGSGQRTAEEVLRA